MWRKQDVRDWASGVSSSDSCAAEHSPDKGTPFFGFRLQGNPVAPLICGRPHATNSSQTLLGGPGASASGVAGT